MLRIVTKFIKTSGKARENIAVYNTIVFMNISIESLERIADIPDVEVRIGFGPG